MIFKLKQIPLIMACAILLVASVFIIQTGTQKKSPAQVASEVETKDLSLADTVKTAAESVDVKPVSFTVDSLHHDCESKPQAYEKFDCYEQGFTIYMKTQGGMKTLQLMEDLQKRGGYALSNCHPLTHKIGNIALHVYGSVLNAVPEYIPVCASGYYHGLLEEYLATARDYKTGIVEVCGTPAGKDYFNWFQCVHGEGHGIMQYRENDVLVSLKDCDLVDPAGGAQEICYAGVFMENITTEEKTGHTSKYIKADNPIYPCDMVETKYKSACYFLSSSMILKLNGWNFADGFKSCDTKAETAYRWLCYESMGRDVSGSTYRNKDRVIELCMLGATDMRGECFFGAVRDFVNEKGTFDTGIDLCNAIPADHQDKCYGAIYLDLGLYKTGQEYLSVCQTMPKPRHYQCAQLVRY